MIFWNSFLYWKTYGGPTPSVGRATSDKLVINRWILARLDELKRQTTNLLDDYNIVAAARKIEDFVVKDISHWYIRRIRSIMKDSSSGSAQESGAALGYVLFETSKLLAPFLPFISERLYKELRGKKESVHLEDWPKTSQKSKVKSQKLLQDMEIVRRIVSQALEARAKAGIKVRQPLAALKISRRKVGIPTGASGKSQKELLELIKKEVNVKEIIFDKNIKNEVELDVKITPELKEEGMLRDLIRSIQDFRKKSGLEPYQKIEIFIEADSEGEKFARAHQSVLKRGINASAIKLAKLPKSSKVFDIKLDGLHFKIGIIHVLPSLSN
jgi:isoleucyl-tRNA synthetase